MIMLALALNRIFLGEEADDIVINESDNTEVIDDVVMMAYCDFIMSR